MAMNPECYACKKPVDEFTSTRSVALRGWFVEARCHGDHDYATLTDNVGSDIDPVKDWHPFEPDDFFACPDTGRGDKTDVVVVAMDGRKRVLAGPIPSTEICVASRRQDPETRRVFRRVSQRDEQGRRVYCEVS